MNIMFGCIIWLCVFTMKLYGLIDLSWWIVAPMAFISAVLMTVDRK